MLVRPPGLVIILKWSKSCQRGEEGSTVPLPKIPAHPLCPLQAYREMLAVSPTHHPNQPLLMITGARTHRPSLTTGQLTRTLQDLMTTLGYSASQYSLHSLRAGGATTAYHAGVDPVQIKRHGTWSSECLWRYVAAEPANRSQVAAKLAIACQKH